MKEIVLYTDGACSGNPGMGGWGAILSYQGREKVLSGGEMMTTNNRMELTAVIEGLKAIKEGCKVDIYSDSAYVVNAFLQDWISKWRANGWRSSKGAVLNTDLWKSLLAQMAKHEVKWHKVKGHADNENNNRCDALARGEIDKLRANQEN
ncbi:MAG: ribonuclease HI [Clostridia bacterium]|nr:ribonuclease HI [Clostridia bacterium]